MSMWDQIAAFFSPTGPMSAGALAPPPEQFQPVPMPPQELHTGRVAPGSEIPVPRTPDFSPHIQRPELGGASMPPIPGGGMGNMLPPVGPDMQPLPAGQMPAGPEAWEFGPGVPTGDAVELGAAERAARVAEMEAASANNWGRDARGPQDPMGALLGAYDERTDSMIGLSQEADRSNKWLEMAAGVLGTEPGDYTGAMANVFGVQADYNRRPAGYEGMRAERDSGKIDDLYKIMQTRKAAMGPQGAPMSEKDQWATAGMSPQEIQDWAQGYPGYKYKPFGDGIGGWLEDEQGNMRFHGDEGEYNINTPEGQARLLKADTIAQSRTAASKKQAGADIQQDRKYEVWSGIVGDDPTILGILDIYPSASHEAVMRRAYENVVAELAAGEGVDVSGMSTDELGQKIEQWLQMNPDARPQILESMRRGLPNQ